MRGFWAVLAFLSAALCGPALAGPDDYVFEYRLLDDDGREIVATCRGRAPCVLVEDPLRRTQEFSVELTMDPSGIMVSVRAQSAHVRLQEIPRDNAPNRRLPPFERQLVLQGLPTVLRTQRYEPHRDGMRCIMCPTERVVGSGYLMIRPLPLASTPASQR